MNGCIWTLTLISLPCGYLSSYGIGLFIIRKERDPGQFTFPAEILALAWERLG